MTKRVEVLRRRYIKLTRMYDTRLAQYSCGRELAEHIDSALSEWRHQIEGIVDEVEHLRKEIQSG